MQDNVQGPPGLCALRSIIVWMNVVVSPYHLTTREPAAVVPLLLADQVVTLMPAPFRTIMPDDLRLAAESMPRYRKFVESWQWTQALWESGAIVPAHEGADALGEVRRVLDVLTGGGFDELAPLMRPGLFDDEKEYLDAVAGDVLKGGPDPGICVPLTAGLDRFAVRHGLMVARGPATSVAQKAEEAMGRRVFAFSIPMLSQASGELMSDVRADAEEMLEELRGAVSEAAAWGVEAQGTETGGERAIELAEGVSEAARSVSGELGDLVHTAVEACDRYDIRAIAGVATVTGVVLPVDAVLRSSARAARAMIGERAQRGAVADGNLPVVADPLASGKFVGLVVKVVGKR
jgi:hypothetical protein